MTLTTTLSRQIAAIASATNADLILVGGQALGVWVEYFNLIDSLAHDVTSVDIDFFGRLTIAKHLAERLGGKLTAPEPFDPTPHAAVVLLTDEQGITFEIDILKQVYGIKSSELRTHAYAVPFGTYQLSVMHPVHVLKSRLKNTLDLGGRYENERGMAQVHAAVLCAREFLRQRAAENPKDACYWARTIANWAHDTMLGHAAWRKHDIDLIHVIPLNDMPTLFQAKEWPYLAARIYKKRQASGT